MSPMRLRRTVIQRDAWQRCNWCRLQSPRHTKHGANCNHHRKSGPRHLDPPCLNSRAIRQHGRTVCVASGALVDRPGRREAGSRHAPGTGRRRSSSPSAQTKNPARCGVDLPAGAGLRDTEVTRLHNHHRSIAAFPIGQRVLSRARAAGFAPLWDWLRLIWQLAPAAHGIRGFFTSCRRLPLQRSV